MITALRKYDSMKTVIDRCNEVVLRTLEDCSLREAKIAAESFRNGGKRLRPALMILSGAACDGGDTENAPQTTLELAAAIELIHLATLFHDDVIDEVETRRMRLSARSKYGNYISVLAGDYVLAEALLLVQRSEQLHTMPDFLETIRILVQGESRETTHKFDFDLDEDTYYSIISDKSASLFALSCKVGAMTERSEYADLLGRFGWNLGMAFQMIDDLDDMIDLPNGPMDCDLRNGYFALPVIRVLHALNDGHREDFVATIRRGEFNADDQRRIMTACFEYGGMQHAKAMIDEHLDSAATTLSELGESRPRDMLQMIVADLRAYASTQISSFLKYSDSAA